MPEINKMLLRPFVMVMTCALGSQAYAIDTRSMLVAEQDEQSSGDSMEESDATSPDNGDKPSQDEKKLDTEKSEGSDDSNKETDKADAEPDVAVKVKGPLDGKAFLATSFGWVGTSASKGNYRSLGASDITAGYLLPKQFIPGFMSYGFGRFLPVSVTADDKQNHFKGVINYYSFGLKAVKSFRKELNFYGEAGASVFQSRLDPVNEAADSADLEMSGVVLNFSAGADYTLLEKMSLGPRVGAALGNYKFFQFALSFDFLI